MSNLDRPWRVPVTIAVQDCPRSLNVSNHPRSHGQFLKAKAQWEELLYLALLQSDLPRGVEYVHADALLRFPQRRDRDAGNFKTLLEKALGDALQGGKRSRERMAAPRGKRGAYTAAAKYHREHAWLPNDTAGHFQFGMLGIDPERGPKLTRIRLAYYTEVPTT